MSTSPLVTCLIIGKSPETLCWHHVVTAWLRALSLVYSHTVGMCNLNDTWGPWLWCFIFLPEFLEGVHSTACSFVNNRWMSGHDGFFIGNTSFTTL